jgi:hypothetical protein
MISGRQALAQIERTIEEARRQETQLEQTWQAATEEAARLRIEKTEAFRELARLKLDAITKDGLVGYLDAAERQAINLLTDRRQALKALTERRRQAEERVHQAEAERHAAAGALENALVEIETLRRGVEADISAKAEWAVARTRIDELARMVEQAEKKALQAEADRAEKRKPYEADPLFMYLWHRKFGTAAYNAGPLSRTMDRFVARVIGYAKARPSYVLLNEIPVRLQEHVARMKDEVKSERDRLTAMERSALLAAGVEPTESRLAKARSALGVAERKLHEAQEALATIDRTYDSSVLEGDAPYREAVELLAAAASREDLNDLYQKAMKTPTPRDEEIVRRIQATDVMIARTDRQVANTRRQLQVLAQRRAMIERGRNDFLRQGYDNPYGSFGNEVALGNVLGGMLTGMISGAVLSEILRGGFHQGPSPWDSGFGGGFPFPRSGGSGSGSSSGSFGDGDRFDTGGSF